MLHAFSLLAEAVLIRYEVLLSSLYLSPHDRFVAHESKK